MAVETDFGVLVQEISDKAAEVAALEAAELTLQEAIL